MQEPAILYWASFNFFNLKTIPVHKSPSKSYKIDVQNFPKNGYTLFYLFTSEIFDGEFSVRLVSAPYTSK